MPSTFTDEEIALLKQFVTDPLADVFAVKGLHGLVGAVYARYSRAPGGFREVMLKEFLKTGVMDAKRAEDLIQRVLIAFGDDSVGELEGAHVSFENISVLATKEIEDRRIGGSPIEQSTRYVFYDQRDENGRFRFLTPPELENHPLKEEYESAMTFAFTAYTDLIEPMKAHYMTLKPAEEAAYEMVKGEGKKKLAELTDEKQRKAFMTTYEADIRTKTCDTLRGLLPVATKTNVGVFGNGRYFQHMLSHCYGSPLAEVRSIAERGHVALKEVIPHYVARAKTSEYQMSVRKDMEALGKRLYPESYTGGEKRPSVRLLDRGEDFLSAALRNAEVTPERIAYLLNEKADALTIACMLYPYTGLSLHALRNSVLGMAEHVREEVRRAYIGNRKERRDRPGRAFEAGYPYTFDMCTDFGVFKDLERHRMLTMLRQALTPHLGFVMPDELVKAGFDGRVREVVARMCKLYDLLLPEFPHVAQYAALHGSLVQWVIGLNDRAAHHLTELRSGPQGHPGYRKVAQAMQKLIAERSPWRGKVMQFVNHEEVFWSRADSEASQRIKEAKLESK